MIFIAQGKTNWKFLLIIAILAVIVGGGILWCPKIQEVIYQPPEIQGPVEVDETADWQTYRNEEYGFEIKYPNNWFIHDAMNEINCENEWAKSQRVRILFSDKEIEDCLQLLTHGWFWFSIWIDEEYNEENIEKNTLFNGILVNKTIEAEVNEIGDSPRTSIIFNYNNFGWNINYLNNTGGAPADSNFEKMLSTFWFFESEIMSEEEAINLVKSLPEVTEWLSLFTGPGDTSPTTDGKPMVIVDSKSDQSYSIHVYEQLSDHTATFNWYNVNSKTGEITPTF